MSKKTKHSITLHEDTENWLSKTANNLLWGTMNETKTLKYIVSMLRKIYPEGIPEREFTLLEIRKTRFGTAADILNEQSADTGIDNNMRTAGSKILAFPGCAR